MTTSSSAGAPEAPLAGLTVLDFTRVIAGPFLTQMLGDLGARIVKVEAPGVGDDMRHYRPLGWKKDSPGFVALNRNKESIEIDIGSEAGQALCKALAAKADFLVENFRPDVMERYGLNYPAMAAVNPKLIYVSISGYGHATPFRLVAGYDPIAQAETGLMYLTGSEDMEPQKAGGSVADTFTGLHAGMGALAALEARRRTGRGQHIEVSLFDSMLHALGYVAQHPLLIGEDPPRMGNKSFALVPLGVFQCADGPVMIVVGNNRQFEKFCRQVIDRPDLLEDPRFAEISDRLANREPLEAAVEAAFATAPRAHWVERLRAAGVPGGAVRSPMEAVHSEEARARGMIQPAEFDGAAIETVGPPFRFSETPAVAPGAVPARGQHRDLILRELLDMDDDAIDDLRAAGAFGAKD